ncbi:hypothetical protein BDW22DRAFT_1357513 [Trametopsis cervina]|nr:hypothetical protein BDW22DRAFT_1357513 [Trametopsis cervina]
MGKGNGVVPEGSILVETTVEVHGGSDVDAVDGTVAQETSSLPVEDPIQAEDPAAPTLASQALKESLDVSTTTALPAQYNECAPDNSKSYGNLPPLASITFRQSHSIRSLARSSSSRKELYGLSASSSRSSVRRRVSSPSAAGTDPDPRLSHSGASSSMSLSSLAPVSASALPYTGSGSSSGMGNVSASASASSAISEPAATSTPVRVSAATPQTKSATKSENTEFSLASGSWDHLSSFLSKSLSFFSLGSSATAPSNSKVQETPTRARDADTSGRNSSDSEYVTVTPKAANTSSSSSSSTPDSTPSSTPTKKSRLPVMRTTTKPKPATPTVGARFIRRLSRNIGRPVLMESTNAAAQAQAVVRVQVRGVQEKTKVKTKTKEKEKEKAAGAGVKIGIGGGLMRRNLKVTAAGGGGGGGASGNGKGAGKTGVVAPRVGGVRSPTKRAS